VITAPGGTHPRVVPDSSVDTYALTHNETSTGVAMALRRPVGADGLVIVDATSGAGGLRVDPREFDVYYFAPQKCFASDGGLWVALCSPRAVARIESIAASGRWIPASLDLKIALDNSRLNQTYNTPALATLFLFEDQVRWMNDRGGLAWCVERCRTSAAALYGWAERTEWATPFVSDPDQRSAVVGTIDLSGVDALAVSGALRANGIDVTAVHSHMLNEQPRLFFLHFWAVDDASKLAEGLRAALDKTASAKS